MSKEVTIFRSYDRRTGRTVLHDQDGNVYQPVNGLSGGFTDWLKRTGENIGDAVKGAVSTVVGVFKPADSNTVIGPGGTPVTIPGSSYYNTPGINPSAPYPGSNYAYGGAGSDLYQPVDKTILGMSQSTAVMVGLGLAAAGIIYFTTKK